MSVVIIHKIPPFRPSFHGKCLKCDQPAVAKRLCRSHYAKIRLAAKKDRTIVFAI